MINLFTSHYPEKDPDRAAELNKCRARNQGVFDNVFVICEGDWETYTKDWTGGNCHILPIDSRPTYASFFHAINTVSTPGDINVIANPDIMFLELPESPAVTGCYALTRYEEDGVFLNMRDSQDVWIFNGHIRGYVFADFHVGVPGCDNRIAYELQKAGYTVTNPSLSIKTYHVHAGAKSYDKSDPNCMVVPPPYLRLDPTHLQ